MKEGFYRLKSDLTGIYGIAYPNIIYLTNQDMEHSKDRFFSEFNDWVRIIPINNFTMHSKYEPLILETIRELFNVE